MIVGLLLAVLPAQDSLRLADLRAPATPAFALLGIAPEAISRPRTPRALGVELLSQTDVVSTLPASYAIEVAPYWLVSRPTLTFDGDRTRLGSQVLQTLAFSAGTSRDTSGATRAGLGVRTVPFNGRPTAQARRTMDEIGRLQVAMLRSSSSTATSHMADTIRALITDSLDGELDRIGFRMEIAAAAVAVFPTDVFADGAWDRLGAWLTTSYQLEQPRLEASALLRVMHLRGPDASVLEYGGRVAYEVSAITLAVEALRRAAEGGDPPARVATTVAVALNEGSAFVLGFGRGFPPPGETLARLVAVAGLRVGLGSVPTIGM